MPDQPNVTPAYGGRQTRPRSYTPFSTGGVEVIPRRADIRDGTTRPVIGNAEQLRAACIANPLRVLAILADIDPLAAKSQGNTLSLTCAPGDVQFLADRPSSAGAGDDAVDAKGTESIETLWQKAIPPEVGSLKALRKQLTKSLKHYGMAIVECVPGPTGTGVSEIWPVDPMTCLFKRDPMSGRAMLYQHQSIGDVALDPERVLWIAADPDVDDPYGRPKDAAALPAVLRNMALSQDLADSVHNSAWKRLVYKYSLKALYEIAVDVLQLPESRVAIDPDTGLPELNPDGSDALEYPATDWVQGQIDRVTKYMGSLKPDDNLVVDSSGGVDDIDGGDLAGVDPVVKNFRLQVIQALGDSPTMVGVDGPSFNFGSVAWSVQAQLLEDLRDDVVGLLVRVASLHLKLKGKALTARAKVRPIRTTDALVDAQAKQYEINNVLTMLAWGFLTPEQAALELTGSGIPPEMQALVLARIDAMKDSLQAPAAPQQKSPADGDPTKPALPAGSTAEEKGAVASAT